jgi:hypothetical protein
VLTSNLLTISLGELKCVQLVRPLWVKEKAMNEFRSEQVNCDVTITKEFKNL